MRVKDLFEAKVSPIEPLKIRRDNPQGEWLQNKQKKTESYGFNPHGFYSVLGTDTATFNRDVLLPVELLASIKGYSGEQENVRQEDLTWLRQNFQKTDMLPQSDAYFHQEYPPMIGVDQRGVPAVLEGNHRIMAAKTEGLIYLAATVRYYNGGELEDDGLLHPTKVKQMDAEALQKGFAYGVYR